MAKMYRLQVANDLGTPLQKSTLEVHVGDLVHIYEVG